MGGKGKSGRGEMGREGEGRKGSKSKQESTGTGIAQRQTAYTVWSAFRLQN